MYVKPNEELLEGGKIIKEAKTLGIDINSDTMKLFDFYLEEQERKGEFLELCEDDKGSYIMNSKDLCLMPKLDKLLSIGIDSLKVSSFSKSSKVAFPSVTLVKISSKRLVPIRHCEHLPQLSSQINSR